MSSIARCMYIILELMQESSYNREPALSSVVLGRQLQWYVYWYILNHTTTKLSNHTLHQSCVHVSSAGACMCASHLSASVHPCILLPCWSHLVLPSRAYIGPPARVDAFLQLFVINRLVWLPTLISLSHTCPYKHSAQLIAFGKYI